jgi:DNA-binding response OmpR family regulator/HPt (histidine-containing phosphotransfer) domain-containing protein
MAQPLAQRVAGADTSEVTTPSPMAEVLAKLRERFAASSGNTLAAFTQHAEQLQRAPSAPEVVDALRRELHRVHGTAGSYGFHEASRIAGALELVAIRWAADPALDSSRRAAIVRQFVRALGSALTTKPEPDSPLTQRLLLVGLSDDVAAPLVTEGMHRGFFVERTSSEGLSPLLDSGLPRAVVATARIAVSLPESVPLVLLHVPGEPIASHGARARVIDAATDPRDVLQIAESIAAHTGMAGATMLVVDDDPAMLDLLRAIGEGEGMFVVTLDGPADLDAALLMHRPALLLLDIAMPGEEGIAVTQRLRADRTNAELSIMLVSARTDSGTRDLAFRAGADDFQPKPVVAIEITRRLERLLELRRQRLIARGIHPATGLWLPERTTRELDETVRAAAAGARPSSVAVIRPLEPADGLHRAALWHRDARRIVDSLAGEAARGGFLDESTLAVWVPRDASGAVARLGALHASLGNDVMPWCAGVSGARAGVDSTLRELIATAEEGWMAARDAGAPARMWDEATAGVAPDVIVVEDDAALADLMTFALAARGLTNRVHRTGPEALEALRALRVRGRRPVLLLDVDLPGLDGFSLFERLREERPGDFLVVFISVHASESDQLRAIRAGALDYIAKPVSLRVLLAKIAVWRERARAT